MLTALMMWAMSTVKCGCPWDDDGDGVDENRGNGIRTEAQMTLKVKIQYRE